MRTPLLHVGRRSLSIEDVLELARGTALPALDPDPEVHRRTLLAARQGVELRGASGRHPRSAKVLTAVRASVLFNDGDRRQDVDIVAMVERLQKDALALGTPEEP